jgi:predicted small lipoprotein YifL
MPCTRSRLGITQLIIFILICFVLAGCGKGDPIELPVAHHDMYGVWEKTETKDNGLSIHNMLLVFHSDSTVTYVRCMKKIGRRSSQSLPGLNLIRFAGNEFDIQIAWGVFSWTEHFTVARFPYQENGQTYLDVNGVKLRKLLPNETSDYANWPCNDDKSKDN